jgi:hypothetical protein
MLIKVILQCGDQITSRNSPLNKRTTYVCPAGNGHGYNVRWVSYTTAQGFTKINPAIEQETVCGE